jgi:outer membrane protein OmpA-like peptidoglycan-associated protein
MDRLYFETGKATLKPASQEQLKNIAAILKAYPAIELKLGGYTDNSGDSAAKVKLSGDRATTAKNELVKLGADAARLSAEGYGAQYPVCPENDTKECKAQNRRIDIRVTKK